MTRPRKRLAGGMLALVVVATALTGCLPAKVGTRCKGTELGRDSTHVLTCTKGRWTRAISFDDAARLFAAKQPRRPLSGIVQVATGEYVTCAVIDDGSVKCWGGNRDGELGTGTNEFWRADPRAVPGVTGATAVATTRYHVCALVGGGAAKCWGSGSLGELGNGGFSDSRTPVDVLGLSGATAIAAGNISTCVIVSNGEVQCWGYGKDGGLGNESFDENRPVPTQVIGVSGATQIGVGSGFACALVEEGVKCWGDNISGQLGDGTKVTRAYAVDVVDLDEPVTALTVGGNAACATLESGHVRCWGDNFAGQLGVDTPDYTSRPIEVPNLSDAQQVSIGTGGMACAVTRGSAVTCWGFNQNGELGDGSLRERTNPNGVISLVGATRVSAGGKGSCARMVDATVKCWGGNFRGEVEFESPWGSAWPTTVTEPA